MPDNKKFYFTYGTSDCYPFKGGWTLIYAPNKTAAAQIFKAYHPNPNDSTLLNCCDYYDAQYFEKSSMYIDGNLGVYCHEIIAPITGEIVNKFIDNMFKKNPKEKEVKT